MSENSKIEWTDHTFNPWEGCTKVSPGCAHCYAEARNARFGGGAAPNWGKGAPRRRTSKDNWKLPLKWNHEAERAWENFKAGVAAGAGMSIPRRPRVFCASLADWLDDEVPAEWQNDLLRLIQATPHLDWLLLSKRPENWEGVITNAANADIDLARDWSDGIPPANIWLGTTVEDQTRADERIPLLLSIPAKVRFLSCEPLLGPVDLQTFLPPNLRSPISDPSSHHWVICGGESGPAARPMHPDWARSLRDQCVAAKVPLFFKQWGEYAPCAPPVVTNIQGKLQVTRTWRAKDRHVECKDTGQWVLRVGKSAAGRLLDGRQWNQMPEIGAENVNVMASADDKTTPKETTL